MTMKHIKLFENFDKVELNDLQREVYLKLKEFGDMSPNTMRAYASNDIYYMDNEENIDNIVRDIRDVFEEDNKPSEHIVRLCDAINSGRLKIIKGGEKNFGKYKLSIQEYVWGRNFMDGYGIDVYLDGHHEGTIHYLAPEYIATPDKNN